MSMIEWAKALDDMVPDAPLAVVSIVCLSIVVANAALVVSAVHLRPSLLRALSKTLLGLWATATLMQKLEGWHTSPLHLMLHLALAGISIDSMRALWADWKHPVSAVCNHRCQAISCSMAGCPARHVLPVVRLAKRVDPNG